MNEIMIGIATWTLPVLLAITLHEVAHGWAALALGDRTAQMLGRLSLNPIKHVDPIGTVALPLILIITSSLMGTQPFVFGWAKPVPIDTRNLASPRKDMAWIAVAGPASNFVQAVLWLGLMTFSFGDYTQAIHSMAIAGISINVLLIAFNLLPLPPLDGSRLVAAILPKQMAWQYDRLEPYGFIILLILMAMGWLSPLISPVFTLVKDSVFSVASLIF